MNIKFNVLIIATDAKLVLATAPLFERANFNVHLIGLSRIHHLTKYSFIPSSLEKLARNSLEALENDFYHLVILADDMAIGEILKSDLTLEQKLRLLPIMTSKNVKHLFSKCGLSEVLSAAKILTPEFKVCKNLSELCLGANHIGFPLMIKVDSSGGGAGVFECNSIEEVKEKSKHLPFPLLLQKKINGKILDLTAFYQNTQLIYFSYSEFSKTRGGPFGPSLLRKYTQIGGLPKEIFQELGCLGLALGANGFVNITCIECVDTGKRFYIEADMRPNIWVDKSKLLGFDISAALSNFFLFGTLLTHPHPVYPDYPLFRLIAHVDRLKIWELLINRYGSLEGFDSAAQLISYLQKRIFHSIIVTFQIVMYQIDLRIRLFCSYCIKPLVPRDVWKMASQMYKNIFKKNI